MRRRVRGCEAPRRMRGRQRGAHAPEFWRRSQPPLPSPVPASAQLLLRSAAARRIVEQVFLGCASKVIYVYIGICRIAAI